MRFKSILSFVESRQSDKDIHQALDLCREMDAHLSVAVVATVAAPPVGAYAPAISEAWWEERNAEEERLNERVREVTQLLEKQEVPSSVEGQLVERATVASIARDIARFCDLTLIGVELATNGDLKSSLIDGVLFEAERPVLIAPEDGHLTLRPATVLVAWNSSPEALRAVRESIELLAAAQSVHVTMVDPRMDSGSAEPGIDIAAYLARHGVKVTLDHLPGMGRPDSEVLMRHAVDISADLLVMGAYGHSRLRERIFGGVTRAVIESVPMPVLMAR